MSTVSGHGRGYPGEQSAEENQADDKEHNHGVRVNRFDATHVLARPNEPLNGSIGHQQAKCAARGRQKKTLDQVLAQQTPAAGTQRRANRHFLSPRCAACHKKTCYVQTRNQENAKRRHEQNIQGGLDITHHVIKQRSAVRGLADVWIIYMLIV